MTTKTFRFDDGVELDAGLAFSFARASSTLIEHEGRNQGQIGPNIPRFGARNLLCGAPAITTVAGTTSEAHDLMAVGVDADGVTPVYVVKKPVTAQTLTVYVGSLSGPSYSYDIGINGSKQSQVDGLRDSTDVLSTEAWNPKACVVCHGLIVLLCNVHHNDGTNWGHRRLGIATCKVSDLTGAKNLWWRRHAITDVLPGMVGKTGAALNVEQTASFSLQTYMVMDRTGERPVKVWFAGTDYQSGQAAASGGKFGGIFWVMPATRPDISSGTWTVDAAYELHRFSRTPSSAHAHGVALTRSGTLGINAICGRGDGSANNCNYALRLASEGSATGASTAYRTGASLGSNGSVSAVNFYSGASSWAAIEYISGVIDDEGAPNTPTTPDDAPATERRYGVNQGMALLPGPTPGSVVISADETDDGPWWIGSVPAAAGLMKWRSLHGVYHNKIVTGKATTQSAKVLGGRNLSFNARMPSPEALNGPVVFQLSPSEFAFTRDLQCRIFYSPNGTDFEQCWAHRCVEQVPPILDLPTGVLWCGDANGLGFGIRSIPEPSFVLASPLEVSNGAVNYLKAMTYLDCTVRAGTPVISTNGRLCDAGAGVGASPPVLPVGVANPPVPNSNIFKIAYTAAIAGGDLCNWVLTTAWNGALPIPAASSAVKIRLWVLMEPPETFPGTPKATTGTNSAGAQFRFRPRFTDNVGPFLAGYTQNITVCDNSSSGWIPITIEVEPRSIKAFTNNYQLELFMESGSGSAFPLNMYVAFESITVADAIPYPVSPAATGDNELVAISDFSAAGSFTMVASGETPRNCAWDMSSPDALYDTAIDPTNASGGSATQTKLTNAISSVDDFYNGCRIFGNDQTKFTHDAFGLLITDYVGATKMATHASQAGTRSTAVTGSVIRPCVVFDSANPGRRPLWSACNAGATAGFTVFADTAKGQIYLATWNGSVYGAVAAIDNVWWLGGSPVHSAVVYDSVAQTLTLRASAGGVAIGSASLSSVTFAAALTEVRFRSLNASPTVTPMRWFGGAVDDANALGDGTVDAMLTGLGFLQAEVAGGGGGGSMRIGI